MVLKKLMKKIHEKLDNINSNKEFNKELKETILNHLNEQFKDYEIQFKGKKNKNDIGQNIVYINLKQKNAFWVFKSYKLLKFSYRRYEIIVNADYVRNAAKQKFVHENIYKNLTGLTFHNNRLIEINAKQGNKAEFALERIANF